LFDFQKKPEFQNLASKKPNWQPCPTTSVATGLILINIRLLPVSTPEFFITVLYKLNASITNYMAYNMLVVFMNTPVDLEI